MEGNLKNIATALSQAQAEFPKIKRSKTVNVKTKEGYTYQFSYAPLEELRTLTKEVLSKNDLSVIQSEEEGYLISTLYHSSGEFISTRVRLVFNQGSSQAYGSALTYARRYGYATLLGLASEDDDDGNISCGNFYESPPHNAEPDESKVMDLISSLESAETMEDLQVYFKEAATWIRKNYPHSMAINKIIKIKDARKVELGF